ncbi:polysialyltransferase family glycosyltransferase [Pedobacter sp. P351]|uniref:polysialyltransferase family glycosyltransferase n=1 Tax=Pedobacter superstes TaxID=3133441 RepID=UPI0030A37113
MDNGLPHSKTTLLAVQGPTQFIAAYIAFLWYNKVIAKKDPEAVLLIYDTYAPSANESPIKNAILKLASIFPWHDIVFLNESDMRKISLSNYKKSISKLRVKMLNYDFEEIFIARDYGSFGTQLILNTYPTSLRFEYGDSFGLVGDESAIGLSFKDFFNAPLPVLKSVLKQLIFWHFPARYKFTASILSMPLDWTGSYLKGKQLMIPSREFGKKVFTDLADQIPELANYCNDLLKDNEVPCNLYLLSNLANSGLSTFENELGLYEEIINETAESGTLIILKNHPRGSEIIIDRLREKLNKSYNVKIINREAFSAYPIELWTSLLNKCNVYPIFSTSVISLMYLLSKGVIMTLDIKKIERYIYPNKRDFILESEKMSRQALATLIDWDAKSPLWSGSKV